ncbi:MAG: DUF4124 domain-containing protein [Gammaproteobacteria bacterium]|nr:DUF4124 domain-containing protein [Gammaproteobacteria bacterium]
MRKTTRINRKLPILLISCICLSSQLAVAEMYKWVDDEGNTHYTQSPPPGDVEKEIIKPPPRIDSEHSQNQLENRKKNLSDAREGRLKANEKKENEQQELEQQRAACEQAKARLASYQRPRVKIKDKDGNATRASEEQRQKEIVKSRELIAELCK